MACLLSLIIPVYNAECYLAHTLETVCKQTIFNEMEVILINDGSTDNSGMICDNYSKKYSNIKSYTQENAGVSEARNNGILKATGTYITFLDSDDYVVEDLYEKEVNLIRSCNADIAVIDFIKIHNNGDAVKYRENFQKKWESKEESLKAFFKGTIGNQVVDKIFVTEKVKKIKFPVGYKIGEDMWFVYNAIKQTSTIIMDTSISGYYYIVRNSSAMNGSFSTKYFDPVLLSKMMLEDCEDNQDLKKYAEAHLIHETCKVLEYTYRHRAAHDFKIEVDDLRMTIKKYPMADGRKYLIRKQFYGLVLMRLSPSIYMRVHSLMKIG